MRPTVKAAWFLALAVGLINPSTDSVAQTSDNPDAVSGSAPDAAAQPVVAPHKIWHARRPAPAPVVIAPTTVEPAHPPGARLSPGTPIPPADLEALVDGVVLQAMTADHIAGVSVSVVQNGQVVLKKGYGFARRAPARAVDPDRTLFRLGPVSDLFTWMAAMREVEAGHIRLKTPLNLYLPESLRIPDQHFKRPINFEDLMTHAAGFEDRRLGQLFEIDASRIRPLNQYLRQERPRRVREAATLSSPTAYDVGLAGAAVTYVTGKPFEALVENEIITPLGLSHTTFREPYPARGDLPAPMPAALAADLSEGYRWTKGEFQRQPFGYASQIAPAEAGSSTASDMARYMLAILGSGQLDGVSLYGPAAATAFRTETKPALSGWSGGFRGTVLPGAFEGWGQQGDTLSFAANLITVPQLNLGIFIAANTETGEHLTRTLPALIVERFYAPPTDLPLAATPNLVEQRGVYAGAYMTTRRAYGGLEKFVDQLQGWVKVAVTRDGVLVVSGPRVKPMAYAPLNLTGQFESLDQRSGLSFQIENDRASRLVMQAGQGAFERIHLLNRLSTLVTLAALTLTASFLALLSLITRNRRDFRQTTTQSRAGLLQTTIAVLWLLSMMCFGLWTRGISDMAKLIYYWPGPTLMIASACALVAAILTLICIGLSPAVWRGGRRVDSWSAARKLGFSVNMAISLAFAVVLFVWGALQPWS